MLIRSVSGAWDMLSSALFPAAVLENLSAANREYSKSAGLPRAQDGCTFRSRRSLM